MMRTAKPWLQPVRTAKSVLRFPNIIKVRDRVRRRSESHFLVEKYANSDAVDLEFIDFRFGENEF